MAVSEPAKTASPYFKTKICVALLGSLVLMQLSLVAGNIFYQPQFLVEPAYKIDIPGGPPPIVDMAALQRSWPGGLRQRIDRDKLLLHMSAIKSGAAVTGQTQSSELAQAQPREPEMDLAARLALADPAKGERVARLCGACHSFEQGGADDIGPNLWNIIKSDRARQTDFQYSKAMREFGGTWSVESLFSFIENPKAYIKGTAMLFIGLKKPQDRANLIAYLNTMSDRSLDFSISQAPPE